MNNFLKEVLDSSTEFRNINENLEAGKKSVLVTGLLETQRADMSAYLLRNGTRHAVVAHSDAEAQSFISH